MALHRTCSECGASLAGKGPHAKTCSDTCRATRSRRARRGRKADARHLEEHERELTEIVRREAPELANAVIREELRPIVREAITEDVLRAINTMVALAPRVVELIAKDLEDEDSSVRQRAYTLVSKYTLGHPALVRPEEEAAGKQIVVNFQLPRPGGVTAIEADEPVFEIKQCDVCGQDKPATDFVAQSTRCTECHEKMLARAQALVGD